MKPQAVEFLVHMSLATAAAAVNPLAEEVMVDAMPTIHFDESVGTQDSRYSVRFSSIFAELDDSNFFSFYSHHEFEKKLPNLSRQPIENSANLNMWEITLRLLTNIRSPFHETARTAYTLSQGLN